ncbi:thioredoxin O2, mitochondrial-like [Gastrolobium bilobum]|uniref:thioredoxin O2, mitochondrial-like n=1 Tax=Gastrolobium bilobum TaxID=150636 RepID=UPI002AAFCF39|nr:thioredoxin O2, mitochondrial-like [Gastrolobium bilobum]
MARSLIVRSFAFRNAIKNSVRPIFTRNHNHHIRSVSSTVTPISSSLFATAIASSQLSLLSPFHNSLSFCSASAASDVILVNSEEEFNNILSKVQDNSLHAIFYFTAVWCGPCRFISPIVGELSKKYPHVTTYKIDIDQEALQGTLGKLQITSVPTLHFFQNGKKADELVGADIARLNYITEKLFKKD